MLRTDVISDDLWALIEPELPSSAGRRGRPWNDHRLTMEAVIWRFRTGASWRDLPVQFGAWQSVAERHLRWSQDGTYARAFAAVRRGEGESGGAELESFLSVDSTVVRAHQHAAGARPGVLTGG